MISSLGDATLRPSITRVSVGVTQRPKYDDSRANKREGYGTSGQERRNEIIPPAVVSAGFVIGHQAWVHRPHHALALTRPLPVPLPRTAASRSRGRSPSRASIPSFKLCNYVDRDRTSSFKALGWHQCTWDNVAKGGPRSTANAAISRERFPFFFVSRLDTSYFRINWTAKRWSMKLTDSKLIYAMYRFIVSNSLGSQSTNR